MELVRIFKEHNVFGWISVGTAVLSLLLLNLPLSATSRFIPIKCFRSPWLPFRSALLNSSSREGAQVPACSASSLISL